MAVNRIKKFFEAWPSEQSQSTAKTQKAKKKAVTAVRRKVVKKMVPPPHKALRGKLRGYKRGKK